VKLLFDENLSCHLVDLLADSGWPTAATAVTIAKRVFDEPEA
jgi:predicted nuclease of predicted toxin-antitoxin system